MSQSISKKDPPTDQRFQSKRDSLVYSLDLYYIIDAMNYKNYSLQLKLVSIEFNFMIGSYYPNKAVSQVLAYTVKSLIELLLCLLVRSPA